MTTEKKSEIQFTCSCINGIEGLDEIEVLKHIASCDTCAAAYVKFIENEAMLKAPHYMKRTILQELEVVKRKDKSTRKREPHQPLKQVQLLYYSLRVGFAMCMAILFLFYSPFGEGVKKEELNPIREPSVVMSFFDQMNSKLRVFSDNMVIYTNSLVTDNYDNKEDLKNDK